jgi:hypothetical protein
MKKNVLLLGIIMFAILTAGIINDRNTRVQESITYFPIDPKVTFKLTNTSLNLLKPHKSEKYMLEWELSSTLDRKAYLRQDVGLLFSNGRLVARQGNWKQNTATLIQKRQVLGRGNALYQALTFHYAELHENQEHIFSSQEMSADQLYIVHLENGTVNSFRNVFSKQEEEWKQKLDQQTNNLLHHSWEKGIKYFAINPNDYYSYPLTDLFLNSNTAFQGYSEQETRRIIGNLWEGLYKNYFLGIKKADGTILKPIGSTLPLILIAKDKSHLLVLTETAKGEPTLLRQTIEYGP